MILLQQKYSNHVFSFGKWITICIFIFLLQIPWLNYVSVAKTMVICGYHGLTIVILSLDL